MTEELDPIVNLGRRIREQASTVGLNMERFFLHPSLDGGVHKANGFFLLPEEPAAIETNSTESDPEFDRMIDEARKAEEEQRIAAARERVEKLNQKLNDPSKGILDD